MSIPVSYELLEDQTVTRKQEEEGKDAGGIERGGGSRWTRFCHACCDVNVATDGADTIKAKRCYTACEVLFASQFTFWFQYVIHNKFCNWLFVCGCTWDWDGGWKDCNYFSKGPKCPWCTARANVSWLTDYFLFALMMCAYAFFLYKRTALAKATPRCRHALLDAFIRIVVAPVLIYFLAGTVVGAAFLGGGYPHFIVF